MSKRVSGNLEGHALWVFEKYSRITGKSAAAALGTLIERWTEHDPLAKDQRLTLDDYRRETQGAEIVQISDKVQKKGM
ncbi:MAG TPA: hypothetical protein VFR03_11650 [Thermoanaerobaculia bacterium]|nr:hypothetical protein [Thermoanaerobaculia bacterium]